MKLKVVFFGTPHFVVPVLEELIQHFDVVGIVTTPDVMLGRKKILTPTPVKLAYQTHLENTKNNGAIFHPKILDSKTEEKLRDLSPDLFVVAAYGQIIPKGILDIPKYGSINIHPSLLPQYRGPSPIQSAILHGDTKTGVTFIQMDEEIDHGPILMKKELPLSSTDTFESLHVKLFIFAAELLPTVVQEYVSGKLQPQEQDHSAVTYCDHITRQDGYFDIAKPPSREQLDRMIRAYFPWPTAWTKMQIANGKWLMVKFLPEKRIQVEGGKAMTLKEFFNGHPELKGTILSLLG